MDFNKNMQFKLVTTVKYLHIYPIVLNLLQEFVNNSNKRWYGFAVDFGFLSR